MNKIKDCRYGPMIYNPTDTWVGRSFNHYGEFSQFEVSFLTDLLQEGDFAIDVGANIGAITVPLAQKVGDKGMVVAIEPQQFIYHTLCGNVAVNNLHNVVTFHRACSNKDEVVLVPIINYDAGGNYGGVSLEHQDQLRELYSQGKCYPVPTLMLDQLRLPKVNLIKIDVEGMELEVLQGARKTIEQYRPFLYIECDRQHKVADIVDFLESLNYSHDLHITPLFNENNFCLNQKNVLDTSGRKIVSGNLFAWHQESHQKAKPHLDKNPQFFRSTTGQFGTTSSAHEWRLAKGDYDRYLQGKGIDIGAGGCPLDMPNVDLWDVDQGDATYLVSIPDEKYDFVYSSHCLEHLKDVEAGLENWCRVLKPDGYLFVAIPDWTLYEKEQWPSKFNSDHKNTFSLNKLSDRPNHYTLADLTRILDENGIDLIESRLEDYRYDYSLPKELDQTKLCNALAQVCIIGKKRNG